MPMRMVEGFDIDVLPQPYHMQPTPTPRRSGPSTARLKASASARNSAQRGFNASRHGAIPALASRTWPVAVG